MPKIQAGDVELYYEDEGEGEPLVLIPGFSNGLWIWLKQIPALSQKFRTIAFDPRGIARSVAPDRPISTRLIADDVAALLGALKVERAHILGASFGGFVAQEFALGYPQMTHSLILCCTSFGGPNHVPPPVTTLEAIASTKGLNTEERVRENLLLAFSRNYMEENRGEVEHIIALRAANHVPEYAYMRQLQAAVAFNAEERVKEIDAPTLVITGDEDIIVPSENSRNLAAGIPNAKLVVINGGSHTFFIERAEEFNRAVIEFLKAVISDE
ncbi:MAG TPA: alpha/beta hydrolase [Pyrinomonadaceae bacterium]|nr:alpha/beta hydrolase [Pyrinomonadaceae bacterium]